MHYAIGFLLLSCDYIWIGTANFQAAEQFELVEVARLFLLRPENEAIFTIETGGQKCHVMWISTNQQAAW